MTERYQQSVIIDKRDLVSVRLPLWKIVSIIYLLWILTTQSVWWRFCHWQWAVPLFVISWEITSTTELSSRSSKGFTSAKLLFTFSMKTAAVALVLTSKPSKSGARSVSHIFGGLGILPICSNAQLELWSSIFCDLHPTRSMVPACGTLSKFG